MKHCKRHQLDYEGAKCRRCNSEAVQQRREKVKLKAVEYKGGRCSVCGYNECIGALQFHHVDPTTKEFGIARGGHTRSWARMIKELDKCILVCANCHAEIEYCNAL